jgi:hypothetical protein
MVVFAFGCAEMQTAERKLDQVVLLDVQGYSGGTNLWISKDGKAICIVAVPPKKGETGLQDTRYEFVLSEQQRSSLIQLITKNRFFTIKTRDRYGVPDEARPNIFVKSGATTHAVGKWVNDKNKDFDSIYQNLLQIAESGKSGKQIHHGPFDWNWKPDGFPENKSIREMTKLNE